MVSRQYAIWRPIQLYDFDHHEQPKGKKTTLVREFARSSRRSCRLPPRQERVDGINRYILESVALIYLLYAKNTVRHTVYHGPYKTHDFNRLRMYSKG